MFTKKPFVVVMFVFSLILVACTVQAAGSNDTPGNVSSENRIGEIEIGVNSALATGVKQEWIPATVQDKDAPNWAVHPEYLQVSFENYALEGTFHTAQIHVYPTSAFEAVNQAAAEKIAELHRILQQHPPEVTGEVPFLPLFNAAQVIQTQFEYLTFEGGTGIRFVTQYGQGIGPINNKDLFYTFQGLTDDGDYYVTAILPVSHPDLPADASVMPQGDWERYVSDVQQQLNAADPSSFQPDLTSLDQMIRTLTTNNAES